MKAAFFVAFILPPPSSFSFMLIGQNRAGAGLAANADVPLLVQLVIRDIEHFYVGPNIL